MPLISGLTAIVFDVRRGGFKESIRVLVNMHEELKPTQEFSAGYPSTKAKNITQKVFRIQKSVKAFRIDQIIL